MVNTVSCLLELTKDTVASSDDMLKNDNDVGVFEIKN